MKEREGIESGRRKGWTEKYFLGVKGVYIMTFHSVDMSERNFHLVVYI